LTRAARRLRVAVSDERGRSLRTAGLARWLAEVAPARVRGTVGIALVSDARMKSLNRTYRHRDYATDVLSFAYETSPQPLVPSPQPPAPSPFLGDIVIARGVARRQARAAGHSDSTELRVLALHGLLHLLGYDHERGDNAMAQVERRLRKKGGLGGGLLERATAAHIRER
jgi:probable rRNA maturation factor